MTLAEAIAEQQQAFQKDFKNLCYSLQRGSVALEPMLKMMIAEACDEAKMIIIQRVPGVDCLALDASIETMGKDLEVFAQAHWQSKLVAPLAAHSNAYGSYRSSHHGQAASSKDYRVNGRDLRNHPADFEVTL